MKKFCVMTLSLIGVVTCVGFVQPHSAWAGIFSNVKGVVLSAPSSHRPNFSNLEETSRKVGRIVSNNVVSDTKRQSQWNPGDAFGWNTISGSDRRTMRDKFFFDIDIKIMKITSYGLADENDLPFQTFYSRTGFLNNAFPVSQPIQVFDSKYHGGNYVNGRGRPFVFYREVRRQSGRVTSIDDPAERNCFLIYGNVHPCSAGSNQLIMRNIGLPFSLNVGQVAPSSGKGSKYSSDYIDPSRPVLGFYIPDPIRLFACTVLIVIGIWLAWYNMLIEFFLFLLSSILLLPDFADF